MHLNGVCQTELRLKNKNKVLKIKKEKKIIENIFKECAVADRVGAFSLESYGAR